MRCSQLGLQLLFPHQRPFTLSPSWLLHGGRDAEGPADIWLLSLKTSIPRDPVGLFPISLLCGSSAVQLSCLWHSSSSPCSWLPSCPPHLHVPDCCRGAWEAAGPRAPATLLGSDQRFCGFSDCEPSGAAQGSTGKGSSHSHTGRQEENHSSARFTPYPKWGSWRGQHSSH